MDFKSFTELEIVVHLFVDGGEIELHDREVEVVGGFRLLVREVVVFFLLVEVSDDENTEGTLILEDGFDLFELSLAEPAFQVLNDTVFELENLVNGDCDENEDIECEPAGIDFPDKDDLGNQEGHQEELLFFFENFRFGIS